MNLLKVISSFFVIVSVATAASAAVQRPTQFVNLAFDGSKSHSMWKKTTEFSRNYDVRFTYFISGVYFLDSSQASVYQGPGRNPGRSDIGFGGSANSVRSRNSWVEYAATLGHEIAGHANGHFNGSNWSENSWLSELSQFRQIMLDAPIRYQGVQNVRRWNRVMTQSHFGFRAPLLGHNSGMMRALSQMGYGYDTSKVNRMDYWPRKNAYGIWNFPLAGIRLAYSGTKTISMDYNVYASQSGAEKGASSNYQRWEDELYETYLNYFKNNYLGNRAPVDIGHHFSQWNGGIYWNAMKRLVKTVCHLPEVVCGTYNDLTRFLNNRSSQTIRQYQAGNFPKMRGVTLPASLSRVSMRSPELSAEELKELEMQIDPPEAHEEIQEEGSFKNRPLIYDL